MQDYIKLITQYLDGTKARGWVPRMLTVAMLCVAALAAAKLTWRLLPSAPATAMPAPAFVPADGAASVDYAQRISGRHMFGQAGQVKPDKKPEQSAVDAPDTTLNMKLKGVIAADNPVWQLAIIAKGKDESAYSIGESIGSGAKLHEVYADRVIIDHNGRLETLRMPNSGLDSNAFSPSESAPTSSNSATPGRTMDRVRDYRAQIMKNPAMLSKLIRTVPARKNGELIGYKIIPKKDGEILEQLGLLPNDIVIELNGQSLKDKRKAARALGKLRSAREVNLVVLRDGVEIPVYIPLQ